MKRSKAKAKRQLTPFGMKVRKKLIELNMTQVELARQVGTTKVYLNYILHGERSGKMYINKIIKVLGLEDEYLMKTA